MKVFLAVLHMFTHSKKHIFFLLFLIPFLMGIGVDLYVPSLPAITTYFGTSSHLTQLTIGFYMLGYALGQLILGVMSDCLGRRKIILMMGACYILVSFIAAESTNIYMLIICRFLQGFSIAGPAVVCRAIASDCFSGLALTQAMTYISISWALGPILGPFLGGYLQHYFNWQASFYFFALYALFTFSYAAITFKETHHNRTTFHQAAILNILKEVLTHPLFLIYAAIGSLTYASLVIFNVVAPFMIQIKLHYSALTFGKIALCLGLGYFIGNLLNRFLVRHVNPMRLILFGIVGCILISLLIAIFGILFPLNLSLIIIPILLLFCLCGLVFPNIMAASIGIFPSIGGTSSAIFGSFVAAGVFILSSTAALLPTHSETPLGLMYFGIFFVAFILFIARKLCYKS